MLFVADQVIFLREVLLGEMIVLGANCRGRILCCEKKEGKGYCSGGEVN